jgi:NAD(P)-dependent dehydrogenase (short-subunit alcohol dehydrogenase family)
MQRLRAKSARVETDKNDMQQRFVVIGAASPFGEGAARALMAAGADVVACDDLGDTAAGRWRHLPDGVIDVWDPEQALEKLDAHWQTLTGVILCDAPEFPAQADLAFADGFSCPMALWRWAAGKQRGFVWAPAPDGGPAYDHAVRLATTALTRLAGEDPRKAPSFWAIAAGAAPHALADIALRGETASVTAQAFRAAAE